MDKNTRYVIRSLVNEREENALRQLENIPEYQEVCRQQEKSEQAIEELYKQFEKNDLLTIRGHDEGELHKTSCETDSVYIQGLRDCFRLFIFLSDNEMRL